MNILYVTYIFLILFKYVKFKTLVVILIHCEKYNSFSEKEKINNAVMVVILFKRRKTESNYEDVLGL